MSEERDDKRVKDLEYYLNKKYPFTVYPSEDGGYVAAIEELPGCITQGETIEEVKDMIEDAKRAWITVTYEDGREIPLPRTEEVYSGKFVVRIPKYLHRRLAEQANKESVSLNQYVQAILAAGTAGQDERIDKLTREVQELKEARTQRELVKGKSSR